jgi:hypothetical protein
VEAWRLGVCPAAATSTFCRLICETRKGPAAAFEPLTDITHIAYRALHEKPELVVGWSSKEQIETNNAMLRNVVEPIVRTASNFQHISILQGTKVIRMGLNADGSGPHRRASRRTSLRNAYSSVHVSGS